MPGENYRYKIIASFYTATVKPTITRKRFPAFDSKIQKNTET